MHKGIMVGVVALICAVANAERIELKTDAATCVVETLGARLISYQPVGGEEVLWNDDPVQIEDAAWAHGGVPTCWPWFSKDPNGVFHGTAWKKEFKVVSRAENPNRSELVLELVEERAKIEYTVTLRDSLKLEMKTVNLSNSPFSFSMAFHPYFRVGDAAQTWVSGVKGGTISMGNPIDAYFPPQPGSCSIYRIADCKLDRTIYVFAENSNGVNVWNPGANTKIPGKIGADGWRHFVAVEPMLGDYDKPVTLLAGESVSLMMGVEVRKGSKLSGYLGKDPRRPGAANEPTGRPFHVLYLGAHPDDADYDYGAAMAKLTKAGAKVTVVSFCNGCKGHVDMEPAALAARRLKEAQAAAKVYGLERYIVNECPDCELVASVEWRERIGRLVRNIAPDMVLTHRNVDYHADHRAVGQIVQDLTYFLGVPHWCPDTPVPEKLPFVMYTVDQFTIPRRIRSDLVMDLTGAEDEATRGFACHASQVFEWMPPESGVDPASLSTPEKRMAYAREHVIKYNRELVAAFGDLMEKLYGDRNHPATLSELSEYSREPAQAEIDFLTSIPGFHWTRR